MAAVKDFYVDLEAGVFVNGITDSSQFLWPQLFNADNLNCNFTFLRPNPSGSSSNPYTKVDVSSASLTVKIWTTDGATLLASQTVFNYSQGNQILSGALQLNTTNMATALAAVTSVAVILEVTLLLSDGQYTVQSALNVFKAFNLTDAPQPQPGVQYLTLSQALGIFVQFSNNPKGSTITLLSPDGTKQVVFGIDNTGAALAQAQQ